ncbi:MAG: hypothetical protein EB103_05245 [Actinobacteria bacterium]|nr:hypothetical protein [Actinomycetota bacterium]
MLEIGYQALIVICLAGAGFCLLLALFQRPPSWWSVGTAALVELALLVQLIQSIVIVSSGGSAVGDTVEFFGYIFTALLIPPAAVIWAVFERTKWSTLVIGLASLTVAIMVVRMWQIWSGNAYQF